MSFEEEESDWNTSRIKGFSFADDEEVMTTTAYDIVLMLVHLDALGRAIQVSGVQYREFIVAHSNFSLAHLP